MKKTMFMMVLVGVTTTFIYFELAMLLLSPLT